MLVLADTSVWIDHLRGDEPGLAALLNASQVACHPFVVGELACGNLRDRANFLHLLEQLPQVSAATHDEVLALVDAHHLAGNGLGWIDMHLLAAARINDTPLWTQDKRLRSAAAELSITYAS